MTEYVKILSGAAHASMRNSRHRDYVRLTRAEESPGAGWYPVVKVLPKPVPREDEELAYSYTVREDGKAYKEYFLVPEGQDPDKPRRWTRLDILTALGESGMFDAAFAYLNSVEVKPHITAWLGLTTANYIEEGYPDAEKWSALLNGAATALGKTREEIDAFLDTIPTEN